MKYTTVVGLEIHAELSTDSKAYCGCKNQFGAPVNTLCCPVCMGLPGALPTLNEKVLDYAILAGLAANCKINDVCKQDRKNYFYPDLTKGYQVTQSDVPLCEGGYLDVIVDPSGATKRFGITRIHIEEDTGKLMHDDSFDGSLVDFNRCGVPLIEIVTEPDFRSASDARAFLETMRNVLIAVGVSDAKMQEGSIRCDVNVSVMPEGSDKFGTRVEMKNLNSFSAASRAIEFESARQIAELEAGGVIEQETRRWDDMAGENYVMRSKEFAHDYRYFPEPDLLTIVVDKARIEELRNSIPELPHEKTKRFLNDYKLAYDDAATLLADAEKAAMFEAGVKLGGNIKLLSNWLSGDISRLMYERGVSLADTKLTAEKLCEMTALIEKGTISSAAGKSIIERIMFEDITAAKVVEAEGLSQISDESALNELAAKVVSDNPKAVEDFKNGKSNALGFLVGQCMKLSKGKGNPEALRRLVESYLNQA